MNFFYNDKKTLDIITDYGKGFVPKIDPRTDYGKGFVPEINPITDDYDKQLPTMEALEQVNKTLYDSSITEEDKPKRHR